MLYYVSSSPVRNISLKYSKIIAINLINPVYFSSTAVKSSEQNTLHAHVPED